MATVIPTEEAIEMLRPGHRPPSNYLVRQMAEVLERQGLIEPIYAVGHRIDTSEDPHDIIRVYAAVELCWDTVLVDFEGDYSG